MTIPLEFRFPEGIKEVFIRRVGKDIVLSPRPVGWGAYFASALPASGDFMAGVVDLPVQEREFA